MKKLISLIILLSTYTILAQAPQKMSYQAIIRNAADGLVVSSNVGMKVSILKGSVAGNPVYVETHTGTTNVNGLLSIEIGTGSVISGTFAAINWGNDSFFIKTETDPDGGSNYTITGTSQLLSVPYALYAENTKPTGKSTVYLKDDVTQAEALDIIANEVGPNTESVYITDTTLLTSVDLSAATSLIHLYATGNTALTSLKANAIVKVYDQIKISSNPVLTTLEFNAITKANMISIDYNNALQVVGFPNLKKSINALTIANCPNVTAINLPQLITGTPIIISRCQSLTTLNLQNFANSTGAFSIDQCSSLTSITAPNLVICSGIYISNNSDLLNVSFPSLQYVTGNITISGNQALTTISTPSLLVSNIYYMGASLTTVDFSSLDTAGVMDIRYTNIQNLNFPLLTKVCFNITNNPQLIAITIPNLTTFLGVVNYFSNNHLPSSEVNIILHKILTVLPASGKYIYLKQIPAAPPTGQGITDKATLISSGNTIQTD